MTLSLIWLKIACKKRARACAVLITFEIWFNAGMLDVDTLQGTNISPEKSILKMIFLFPRWDMLISWRVFTFNRFLIYMRFDVFFLFTKLKSFKKKHGI